MAVNIKQGTAKAGTKKKTMAKDETVPRLGELADEIGKKKAKVDKIKAQLAVAEKEMKPLMAEATELASNIQAVDEEGTYTGTKHTLKIGKEGTKREITDKERLIEILDEIEDGLAFNLASFKLTDADSYLTPEQIDEVITKGYTGVRKITVK